MYNKNIVVDRFSEILTRHIFHIAACIGKLEMMRIRTLMHAQIKGIHVVMEKLPAWYTQPTLFQQFRRLVSIRQENRKAKQRRDNEHQPNQTPRQQCLKPRHKDIHHWHSPHPLIIPPLHRNRKGCYSGVGTQIQNQGPVESKTPDIR